MLPVRQTLFKYIDDENNSLHQEVSRDVVDLAFDFEAGDFITYDGKEVTVDKIDRVKQWIEKALKTDAYCDRVYKTSHYGFYTDKIIGYVYDKKYIDALLKNEIDYLMRLCDDIEGTKNIEIKSTGDDLDIKFTVILKDGTEFDYEEGGVTLYV